MIRLTDRQRAVVAANIGLAYAAIRHLKVVGVDDDEAISIAMETLCHAVVRHDPQRGSLTTIAYWMIRSRLWRAAQINLRERRRHAVFERSVRQRKCGDGIERRDPSEMLCGDQVMAFARKHLTERQWTILNLRLRGHNLQQLAELYQCRKQNIQAIESRAIAKIRSLLNPEEEHGRRAQSQSVA